MSARVKIAFVKQHSWHRPIGFQVDYNEGYYCLGDNWLTGRPVPLWRYSWEKAGFGHGRFGYASFGWAQGGVTSGGFGFGKFGSGEFGYYNEVVEWVAPGTYKDGQHCFDLVLNGANNEQGYTWETEVILIVSEPAQPRSLELAAMTAGQAQLSWTGSEDLMQEAV